MKLKYTFFFFVLLICYAPIVAIYLPKTHFGPGIPEIGPLRIISYMTLIVFFIEIAINRIKIIINKWIIIILFFSFIVTLSVWWSKYYSYDTSTLQHLLDSIFFPLFVAFVSINLFSSKERIHNYMKHIIISGFCLSIISMFQFVFKLSVVSGEIRSGATLGNPNTLAIFLVLIIPCLLYAIDKSTIKPTVGWIILLFILGGIICTVSRKGTVTAILAIGIYSLLRKDWKKLIFWVFAILICGLLIAINPDIGQRYKEQRIETTFQGKFAMARAGIEMFKKHPFIGLGYKGYYQNFGKYFPYSSKKRYDAHNEYITALANYGILGFIPFMLIFLYPLFYAFKNLKHSEIQKDMAILGIAIIIPFMLNIAFAGTAFYQQILTSLFYTHTSFIFINKQSSNSW